MGSGGLKDTATQVCGLPPITPVGRAGTEKVGKFGVSGYHPIIALGVYIRPWDRGPRGCGLTALDDPKLQEPTKTKTKTKTKILEPTKFVLQVYSGRECDPLVYWPVLFGSMRQPTIHEPQWYYVLYYVLTPH